MTGTTKTKGRTNKYAANCARCQVRIPANTGRLANADGSWIVLCADEAACVAAQDQQVAADEQHHADLERLIQEEGARRIARGENPNYFDVAADVQAQLAAKTGPAPTTRTTSTRRTRTTSPRRTARTGGTRRKACVTDGNCSSHSGRNCGGWNCDANAS